MRWSEGGQSVFVAPESRFPTHILQKLSPQPTRLGTDSYFGLVVKSTVETICSLPLLYISSYVHVSCTTS
jgi:hypothetical protein